MINARVRQGVPADASPEYSMEDYLVAVGAAVGPMKIMGRDLVQAAIRAYHVLWPNTSGTPDIDEIKVLVEILMASQNQLNLWMGIRWTSWC